MFKPKIYYVKLKKQKRKGLENLGARENTYRLKSTLGKTKIVFIKIILKTHFQFGNKSYLNLYYKNTQYNRQVTTCL